MRALVVLLLVFSFVYGQEINKNEKNFEFNYKTALIAGILTVVSFSLDNDVKKFVQSNKNQTLDEITDFFNNAGSPYILALPVFGSMVGYYSKDEKFLKASRTAAASAVVSATVTFPLKFAVNRERPDKSDNDSFPSGHTALAFSIFGSYAKYYNNGIYPYILYSIPLLVGFSRIYKNKHYFSDVVAGASIGIISIPIGHWLEKNISIRFGIGGYIRISKKETGLTLKYNF